MPKPPERPIAGRVVAITGAARGIGFATARQLAALGARVAIGDLDGTVAMESARALPKGDDSIGLPLDVSDRRSFDDFLSATESTLGPVDVLVNNAGVMFVGSFFDEDDAAMRRMTEVNFYGTLLGMKLAYARMRERGQGHIVNVVSMASWICAPGEATYSGTKHAVKGVGEALRLELENTGIDLSNVYPAVVATELAKGTNAGRSKMLTPDDVATAIVSTIRRPRHEVFVPRQNTGLARLYVGLPAGARTRIAKLFGVDKIATGADTRAARADYETRIGAR